MGHPVVRNGWSMWCDIEYADAPQDEKGYREQALNKTDHQRNALHLYCERLAGALNDAGYEIKHVICANPVEIPWSKETVKDLLWRPIQEAMTGKYSTEDLSRVEPGEVYDVLSRHLGEKFGIFVEWPHRKEE